MIKMIYYKVPAGPLATNAALLACPKTKIAAVIDPAQGSLQPLLAKADELGLKIEKVLLTHSHWDHIADVYPLVQKTGAVVYVHTLDAQNLREPGSDQLPLLISIRGVEPDFCVEEKDEVFVGKLCLEVIHTPGHSPGSVCYYLKEQGFLFSGDTLFQGSFGNLHLPTGEEDKMWYSLEKLAALPPETQVMPGHGEETTIAQESWLKNAKKMFG